MSRRRKHSHAMSKTVRYENEKADEQYFIGYEFFIFAVMIFFLDFLLTTYFRTIPVDDIFIAIFQMMMLGIGLFMGYILLSSRSGPGLRIGLPNKDDAFNLLLYVIFGFAVSEGLTAAIAGIDFIVFAPYVSNAAHFTLSAAFAEEALYSMVLTLGAFIVLSKLVGASFRGNQAKSLAVKVLVSLGVGCLFAISHIARYGPDPVIMSVIFTARFIYSLTYLLSRNIMVPCIIHLMHNSLILSAMFMAGML